MKIPKKKWHDSCEELLKGRVISRLMPKNIDLLDPLWRILFESISAQIEPNIYLLQGENVVVDINGAIWDSGGKLSLYQHEYSESRTVGRLLNSPPPWGGWIIEPKNSLKQWLKSLSASNDNFPKSLPKDFSYVYVADSRSQINFYHWFIDSMVRILAAEASIANSMILLSESQVNCGYVLESLEAIGIGSDRLIAMSPRELYGINNFQYVTGAIFSTGACSSPGIKILRNRLIIPGGSGKSIYLARRSSLGRKIINEAVFLETLSKFGIQTIHPEDHTLTELRIMLGSAKLMIGIYGAALAHLIFLPKGSCVIEIAPKNFITKTPVYWGSNYQANYAGDYYYSLACASDLNYCLIPSRVKDGVSAVTSDIEIDIDLLTKTLLHVS